MAVVTPFDKVQDTIEAELVEERLEEKPKKRKIVLDGEKQLDSNEAARKLKEERRLPEVPGKSVDFETMCKWLDCLNEDQWKRVLIYVYFMNPSISPPDGQTKYVDVITDRVPTLTEIKSSFGSGTLSFWVNDSDGNRNLFKGNLALPFDKNNPPKVNWDWISRSDPRNTAFLNWAKAEGVDPLFPKQEPQPITPKKDFQQVLAERALRNMDEPKKDDTGSVMASVLNTMQEANRATIEMIKAQTPDLATIIKLVTPQNPQQGNTELIQMFQMMNTVKDQATASVVEVLKMQLQAQTQAQVPKVEKSAIEQVKELKEIASIFKRGGSEAKEEGLLEMAMKYALPGLMQAVNTGLALYAVKSGVPANALGMQPANADGIVNPIMQQNPQANETKELMTVNNTNTGIPPQYQQLAQTLAQYANFIAPPILNGVEGAEYAYSMKNVVGNDIDMIAGIGGDNLYMLMVNTPSLWEKVKLKGEMYLRNWCNSFCNYKAEIEVVEESEEEGQNENQKES